MKRCVIINLTMRPMYVGHDSRASLDWLISQNNHETETKLNEIQEREKMLKAEMDKVQECEKMLKAELEKCQIMTSSLTDDSKKLAETKTVIRDALMNKMRCDERVSEAEKLISEAEETIRKKRELIEHHTEQKRHYNEQKRYHGQIVDANLSVIRLVMPKYMFTDVLCEFDLPSEPEIDNKVHSNESNVRSDSAPAIDNKVHSNESNVRSDSAPDVDIKTSSDELTTSFSELAIESNCSTAETTVVSAPPGVTK